MKQTANSGPHVIPKNRILPNYRGGNFQWWLFLKLESSTAAWKREITKENDQNEICTP
jgi:hypothetical protein